MNPQKFIFKKKTSISIVLSASTLLLLGSSIRTSKAETVTLTLSNGDKIHGTLVKSESNRQLTVIDHPSLGRLEIQEKDLKPKPKKKQWTGSFSAGITGSNTDQDLDFDSTSLLRIQYKDEKNLLLSLIHI